MSVKMLVKMFAILTVEEMGLCLQMMEVGGLSEQEAKEETLPRETFIMYASSTNRGQVSEKRHSNKQSVFHTGISGSLLKTRF